MTKQFSDPQWLRDKQYKDASNLEKRVALHQRFSTNPQGWHQWVFSRLRIPDGARVLEVGCGPGLLWAENSSMVSNAWWITLSDFSPGMVGEAQARLVSHASFSFLSCDAQMIPFSAEQFDAVIANHMLYHVPAVENALQEISRVLKPAGVLYATTNGEEHLMQMAEWVRRAARQALSERGNVFPRHMKNFSLQSGWRKLERYFRDVQMERYPDSLRVTDPEAIVSFVSSSSVFRLSNDGLDRLRSMLDDEMDSNGALTITKDPGMFIARKPHGT